MMVLFPFEESFYRSHGVPAKFVGHPAADEIEQITKTEAREKLTGEGACFTVDVLGEEIATLDEAQFFIDEYNRVLDAIIDNDLDATLSIKPTALGLLIDQKKAY